MMFITLEGIEGSGKSTQIHHICHFLKTSGWRCVSTREPGGTQIGKRIRSVLLDPDSTVMDPATELLLYTADRIQHIQEIVLPAIAEGRIVVCDRYFDATMAYQGFARGLDMTMIQNLHRFVCADLKPDLTFLLDLSPEVGLKRAWHQLEAGARTHAESRFENEAIAFHERVRAGYLTIARNEPNRFRIIDAAQTEAQVQAQITRILTSEIGRFTDPLAQENTL
jgi:dTMP kinase